MFTDKPQRLTLCFLCVLSVVGLLVGGDYGLHFNDEFCRERGERTYNYVFKNEPLTYSRKNNVLYGVPLELPMRIAVGVLGLEDSRTIGVFRSMLLFSLVILTLLAFNSMLSTYFQDWRGGFFGCVFLVLSPYIFPHYFFDNQNIGFMCSVVFAVYSLTKLRRDSPYASFFFHGVLCAFATGERFVGVIFAPATIFWLSLDRADVKNTRFASVAHRTVFFIFVFLICTYMSYPLMWPGSPTSVLDLISATIKFNVTAEIPYMGGYYTVKTLPWHYIPVWMYSTIPEGYQVLAILGIAFSVSKIHRDGLGRSFSDAWLELILLGWLIGPVLTILVFKVHVYDSWRHVFFVYPALVFFAVRGLFSIRNIRQKTLRTAISVVVAVSLAHTAGFMLIAHPFQYLYVNPTASVIYYPADDNLRYLWGNSQKQALEFLLKNDSAGNISFATRLPLYRQSVKILPADNRARLKWTNLKNASYYITTFERHVREKPLHEEYIGGRIAYRVYRVDNSSLNNFRPHPDIEYY